MRRLRATPATRPARVVLHIGAPLAGASQLRDVLTRNRRRLSRHGVLYPSSHVGAAGHREAVLDALELVAPGAGTTTGAWDRLAQSARDWRRGTVVVSHELLADADEDQVHRVVSSFGGAQVHVVYVARDLARQLPLAWQEWVRNGGTATFDAYVDKVRRHDGHRLARVFWRSHDVADVLARWTGVVSPEHVHLVTVPDGPDEHQLLWRRLADVLGLDELRLRGPGPSPGLDALAATEVQRLLNVAGTGRLAAEDLARVAGPPPTLTTGHARWLEEEGERAVDAVKSSGCAVVGDVTELRPDLSRLAEDAAATTSPMAPPAEDVVLAQTTLLAALLA